MKSNMLCAFLITMLLFSTAAFSEIVPVGPGASSSASADAPNLFACLLIQRNKKGLLVVVVYNKKSVLVQHR